MMNCNKFWLFFLAVLTLSTPFCLQADSTSTKRTDRYPGSITDIKGILVGTSEDTIGKTGCTAVLLDKLYTGGVDVRGGGPGTLNTDVLSPYTGTGVVDCIMLSGGSAFGLGCATGAMNWLEEQDRGFETGLKRVPMVNAAIIYDLEIGDCNARPTAAMGYAACKNAGSVVKEGPWGGGYAATVGTLNGFEGMEASGQGTSCIDLGNGILVGAIVVVNAGGDVYDGDTRMAGAHHTDGTPQNTLEYVLDGAQAKGFGTNTTIGVVATNLKLDRGMTTKLAMIAHDGYAMAIRPVHTLSDGDTVYSVSTGEIDRPDEINRVLAAAAEAMRRAIVNAVRK